MSKDDNLGTEITSGARAVFERVGEFFHLFDLSFIVSGVASFSAIVLILVRSGAQYSTKLPTWSESLALIIASYVSGLLSFAIGRSLNDLAFRRKRLSKTVKALLKDHGDGLAGLQMHDVQADSKLWRLYARLWQQVANQSPKPAVVGHLSRYWAMAATYDGLAVSCLVWAATTAFLGAAADRGLLLPRIHWAFPTACLVVLALFSLHRGAKYFEYQIEDLFASFVASRERLP